MQTGHKQQMDINWYHWTNLDKLKRSSLFSTLISDQCHPEKEPQVLKASTCQVPSNQSQWWGGWSGNPKCSSWCYPQHSLWVSLSNNVYSLYLIGGALSLEDICTYMYMYIPVQIGWWVVTCEQSDMASLDEKIFRSSMTILASSLCLLGFRNIPEEAAPTLQVLSRWTFLWEFLVRLNLLICCQNMKQLSSAPFSEVVPL